MERNNNQETVMKQHTNTKNTKWIEIKRVGEEREIILFVAVEMLRFIYYLWFVFNIIVGITLTVRFAEEDYKKIITAIYGSVNVCVFLDFAPATYVLPTLFAMQLVVVYQYTIVSIFRAWIENQNKKISDVSFMLYACTFIYFSLSSAIFCTCIAVQPDLKKPETIFLHTLPFTNLIIALTFLQIAVTWFGRKVSWNRLNAPKWLQVGSYALLIGLIITSIFKIIHHANSLGDLGVGEQGVAVGKGLWWSVHESTPKMFFQVVDACYLLSALLGPMIQTGYLAWRKFDTLGVIFTIRSNRMDNRIESNKEKC